MSTAAKIVTAIVAVIVGIWAFHLLVSIFYFLLAAAVVVALGYGCYSLGRGNRAIGTGERKSLLGIPRLPRTPKF